MMTKKVTLLNVSASFLQQLVSIISGLIVPRIILSSFGSSLNGLTASIGQFLSYIALVEGGITGVISANLYKPLVQQDTIKLSSILATARSFYRKIGLVFAVYVAIIAFVYPLVVETEHNYWYVVALTFILSIGLFLEYMFSLTLTTLLNADKKVSVISVTKICITLGNLALVFIITRLYPNLLLLKFASSLLFIFQPLVFSLYVKKHYKINWKTPKDNSLIKERWNGFAINFAAFIHGSTDITLLTFFSDLRLVSVYSIYHLIINKIEILIHSVAAGIEPTIGQAYAKGDIEELNQKMDLFEFIIFFLVGILFSISGMLITPFVMIYTHGINDADYYQPLFAGFLIIAEALYLVRYPHVSLAYSANKFKEITIPAYIEAGINILASLIFIHFIGLAGVALGTVIGMAYRTVFQVHFTSKLVPGRKTLFFYKRLLIVMTFSVIGILISTRIFPFSNYKIVSWIVHGFIYGAIFGVLYLMLGLLFFKKELKYFKTYLKRK